MPGITGIISADRARRDVHTSTLQAMVRVVCHEPSCSTGSHVDEDAGVYVGWVRRAGDPPDVTAVWDNARDILLVLHGELFANRPIPGPPKHGRDTSSAQDVVQLYRERGEEVLAELNGFFSGLLLDVQRRTAILFNDRYGMQRLYVHEDDGNILFASEAKAILVARPNLRRLALDRLAELFTLGCVVNWQSLFEGIRLLEGATTWTFQNGQIVSRETYFDPRTWEQQDKASPEAFSEELHEVLRRVIPRYLTPAHSVGLSLTGGLDTRLILAYAQGRNQGMPCYTFVGSHRDTFDVKIAREVADVCGLSYQTVEVGAEFLRAFPSLAEEAVFVSDGNCGVAGAASLFTNRLAREIAPIRLTGNYGSEIIRGHGEFRPSMPDLTMFVPEFRSYCERAVEHYDRVRDCHGVSFAAFRQAPWFNYNRLCVERTQMGIRTPFMDDELVSLMYRAPHIEEADAATSFHLIHRACPALAAIPTERGEILDDQGMKSALRKRYRWMLKRSELGFDYCMPHWFARIYRYSPLQFDRMFLGRFGYLHFRKWIRQELSGYFRDMLLDSRTLNRSILDGASVRKAVEDHMRGRANHTRTLQMVLSYELIERRLISLSDS